MYEVECFLSLGATGLMLIYQYAQRENTDNITTSEV